MAAEQLFEDLEDSEVQDAEDEDVEDEDVEDEDAEAGIIEDTLEGTGEDQPPLEALIAGVYALRARRTRSVTEPFIGSLLEPASGSSPLRDALRAAATDLERRVSALPAGTSRGPAQAALIIDLAEGLLSTAERAFIVDPERSTLELLPDAERDRFLGFSWAAGDFPGGPPGPNEARAEQMFAALTRLRPERRANRGAHAAVRQEEFDDAMQARLEAALTAVPGERGQRLHRDASAAFVDLRTAAAIDGVTIAIGNSHRAAARARANAERAGNSKAVASFSAHTLGLAVDLKMSHGTVAIRGGLDKAIPKPRQHVQVSGPQMDAPESGDVRLVSVRARTVALGIQPAGTS